MSAFIISLPALERNALILRDVADAAGCRIALALKGFSCWPCFEALSPWLDGCCASGLWEARLARRRFGKHVLTYSPGHAPEEIAELAEISSHLDFNSLTQWSRFREEVMRHPRFVSGELKCGLRVNPQCSTGHTPIYDPCAPGSRLGVTPDMMQGADLSGISGLHFHTLCEQGADDLAVTMDAVERHFGHLLSRPEISWLNMGGGHWITKPDYDRKLLAALIRRIRERYGVEVWLEPGEATAIHTGVLRCRCWTFFRGGGESCHSGCFRIRPHAGYAGNALSAGCVPDCRRRFPPFRAAARRTVGRGELCAGGEGRGKSLYVPAGRPHVPGGRPARRLFLRGAPGGR